MKIHVGSCIFLVSSALLIGCAPRAPYKQELVTAEKKIERVKAVGTQEAPQAALHLKMAQDEVAEAKRLLNDNKPDLANHSLRRAIADADLAEALAREASAQATERQMMDELEKEGVAQ
jgi:hypothetical protein